jgi:phage-related protein
VVAGAQAAQHKVGTAARALSDARGQFTTDQQTLATERSRASSRLESARADMAHWQEEAKKLSDRATWTTVVGAFVWLVKIGDEIASAIQYRQSTEGALAEAAQKLHNAQVDFGALETMVQVFGTLAGLVNQLTGSVQNLANAMTFFTGALTNQEQFAAITTPETETLFLTALRSSLAGLEQEAR